MNAKVRSGVAYVIAFLTVLSCILCIGGCTDEEVAEALNNQSLAPTVEWVVPSTTSKTSLRSACAHGRMGGTGKRNFGREMDFRRVYTKSKNKDG